jgi:hypothetical protein
MLDDQLSELPKSALRDYADDPRVDRVWQRLDADLACVPSRSRAGWVLVPVFGSLLFAAGILVGRSNAPELAPLPEVLAERMQQPEPLRGTSAPAGHDAERAEAPLPADRRRRVPAARASSSEVPTQDVPVEVSTPVLPALPTRAAEPPTWQRQADLGDFSGARAALELSGGWDVALVAASPEQLMTLVDVARASSEREQAVRALRRVLDAFPGAPEAPLAAWTLGNLLDQSGDQAGAADAYAMYRRLSPTGDFAEDAAARQVEVALSQRNLELATQLVDQYEKDFSNGRRLAELREELRKLALERSDAGAEPGTPEPPASELLLLPVP